VVKSRSLAAKLADSSKVTVNDVKCGGASHAVKPGDRLAVDLDRVERILIVRAIGGRRGPAPEAALLFDDITPPPAPKDTGLVAEHGGRPEKSERRAYERLRAQIFDRD
jgi:ribosome-associated heat shock protein Hsp15